MGVFKNGEFGTRFSIVSESAEGTGLIGERVKGIETTDDIEGLVSYPFGLFYRADVESDFRVDLACSLNGFAFDIDPDDFSPTGPMDISRATAASASGIEHALRALLGQRIPNQTDGFGV